MNRTLSKYFRNLSLEDCWYASFDDLSKAGMPDDQLAQLKAVCSNPKLAPQDAYLFLAHRDPLVEGMYEHEPTDEHNDTYRFPFIDAAIPDDITEVVDRFGTQKSKYHSETLLQHVSIVAAGLIDEGVPKDRAIKLALYHDLGKKYTCATNKIGEICFYNHAQISAFILSHWFEKEDDEDEAKIIVAAIYAHMYPLNEWAVEKDWRTGQPVFHRKQFYDRLNIMYCDYDSDMANDIMDLVDKMAKVDKGVQTIDAKTEAQIAKGQRLIFGYGSN